jgi:hypothetical protein
MVPSGRVVTPSAVAQSAFVRTTTCSEWRTRFAFGSPTATQEKKVAVEPAA